MAMDWSGNKAPSAIDEASFEDWGLTAENDTNDLVNARFSANDNLARYMVSNMDYYLAKLKDALVQPTERTIQYNKVTEPTIGAISAVAPTKPSNTVSLPDAPVMQGTIDTVTFNFPTAPTVENEDPPGTSFNYEEAPYVSTLLTMLREKIEDVVTNGGQSLSDSAQQSILSNALSAEDLQHEARHNEAMNFYSSRGYMAPPGALTARLNMLNRETARNKQRITSELANKLAELGHQHGQFCLELGKSLEGLTIDQKDKVQNRALEYAKQVVLIPLEGYRLKMQGRTNAVELFKAQMQGEEARAEAVSKKNSSVVEVYKGQSTVYESLARVQTELLTAAGRLYTAEVAGFEAMVKAETTNATMLIEKFKALVQQAGFEMNADAETAKLFIQQVLAHAQLAVSGMGDAAKATAQVAATALSSMNVSAHLGFSSQESSADNRSQQASDHANNRASYSYTEKVT